MPPTNERVNPSPLAGAELRKIIAQDLDDAMTRNCVLNGVSAFGQVAYEITVKLHFQNLSFPETSVKVESHTPTAAELDANPNRANVQGPPPLADQKAPCPECKGTGMSPVAEEAERDVRCHLCCGTAGSANLVEHETVAFERAREIDSPTAARVEFGLPVPLVTTGPPAAYSLSKPGEVEPPEKTAKYPKGSVPAGKFKDTDRTADVKAEFAEKSRKRAK